MRQESIIGETGRKRKMKASEDFITRALSMKRRILIVEDEEINRLMLAHILEDEYEVLQSGDGAAALTVAQKEKDRLSLILLDLHMPVMDGYTFYEKLQKDPELSRIPVIVLTSEREAEVRSLQMGAADFIPKPYDMPEVIRARIGRTIQLYEDKSIITATQFDPLTGLFQKEFFFEYAAVFDQYYPELQKDMIALNFNRFHMINAVHGREFGDKVLSAIGNAVKDYVAAAKGLACRYDADRFYLYLVSGDHGQALYTAVNEALNPLLGTSDTRIRMGICQKAEEECDVKKKLDLAQLACNSISGNYSVHVACYDEKIREKEHYNEILIRDLEKALDEQQFQVFYQPKFSLQNGEPALCSAEALIRWQHPELGMISPGAFIPLFENNGLIGKVDRFVWKQAASQIAAWKKQFGFTVPVSVNVSRADILSEELGSELESIVSEAGITPREYYLEVTESAYTDNQSDIITLAQSLREKGFTIEMDDFGTGYSSLNMLTELPFDVLKLDMVFVRNIHTDERALRLVEFILDLAKFLQVRVIAEGVECKEQFEILRDLGCDVIQGYYFSKPVCASDFEVFLRQAQN